MTAIQQKYLFYLSKVAIIDKLKALFWLKPEDFQQEILGAETGIVRKMGSGGHKPPPPKVSTPKGYNPSAANGAKPPPFWASWGENFNTQTKNIGDGASKWWGDVMSQSKSWKAPKFELPGGKPLFSSSVTLKIRPSSDLLTLTVTHRSRASKSICIADLASF